MARNGEPIIVPVLCLEQLDHALEQFIVKEYNNQKHTETQQVPIQRWAAGGRIPRTPTNDEELDLLLLTVATARKIHRDGNLFCQQRSLRSTIIAINGDSRHSRPPSPPTNRQSSTRSGIRGLGTKPNDRSQVMCWSPPPVMVDPVLLLHTLQTADAFDELLSTGRILPDPAMAT